MHGFSVPTSGVWLSEQDRQVAVLQTGRHRCTESNGPFEARQVSPKQTQETLPCSPVSWYFKATLFIAEATLTGLYKLTKCSKTNKELHYSHRASSCSVIFTHSRQNQTTSCGWRQTSSIPECLRHKAPLTTPRNEDQTAPGSETTALTSKGL